MLFELNEMAILNGNASKGLPNNVGDCVTIVRYKDAGSYQYEVKLPSGDYAFAKESELNKLTKEQEELVKYLQKGNNVLYLPTSENVSILKVDFLHFQVEVLFDDGSTCIVPIEKIIKVEKESDSVKEYTRTDLHRDVIEEIHNTFKIKNADYGNSFGEQYEEYGLLSAVIRLDDKMRRLKQLMKQDAQVKDENIRDTVLDLANYAIMTVMEMDK